MNRASLARFAQLAADQRQQLWGVEYLWQGRKLCVAPSSIDTTRDLEAGGWDVTVTATLRVNRASFPWFRPEMGQIIQRVGGDTYRIAQPRDNPNSPEWVLGLARDESRA